MDGGIPEKEIAIKTGDKDELKNMDLLSPDCPIRYIITVNALKEAGTALCLCVGHGDKPHFYRGCGADFGACTSVALHAEEQQ